MMNVFPIPAFEDNYIWIIRPSVSSPIAYAVDPGDATPVFQSLKAHSLTLAGVLLTHHHHDHVDGAAELANHFDRPIFGPDSVKMPMVTHKLSEHTLFSLGSISVQILAIPGHTCDHIGYYLPSINSAPGHLFSADTLFSIGCGRVFDSTPETLFYSLQRIANLPDDTIVYPTHEYTLANLRFAKHITPSNLELDCFEHTVQALRTSNKPSLPTTIGFEKRTNPFLRCHTPHIKQAVELLTGKSLPDPKSVFVELRRLKNEF